MMLRGAVLDVETTGLNPAEDEVVEFAIVLFSFDPVTGRVDRVLDRYSGLRDPGRPIPAGAQLMHGISDTDVRGRRLDANRIRSILSRAHYLIAHNATFDRGFVERLFPETRKMTWLCSMSGIKWKQRGFASKNLQNLLAAHGIDPGSAHRALDDAEATLKLLAQEKPDGGTYLRELLPPVRAR